VLRIAQKCDPDDGIPANDRIVQVTDNDVVLGGLRAGGWDVVGGTAWLWAREEMEASVDVLFVDEAGQFSLANTCAVAGAGSSVVLLGDPNQLPQVSQGTHPEGADASALEHLVAGAKSIAPDRGLLLGPTYRLHPDVNAYISDAFYEGRLQTAPGTALQRVGDGEPVGGTGIRFVPLVHQGSANRSRTEAAWIAAAIEALVGRSWTDDDGNTRTLDVPDVLVVAPYNAQVAEIDRAVQDRLGVHANVGTVDKFQGREAPVAMYSLATSSPEEAPRDLEFLYSGNRLNVAVSRARGLAVVVASPELLRVACHTPEQMRLVNAFCRLVEIAQEQAGGAAPSPAAPTVLEHDLPPLVAVLAGATDAADELLLFPELGTAERRRGARG
jgi:uncharacterized protein